MCVCRATAIAWRRASTSPGSPWLDQVGSRFGRHDAVGRGLLGAFMLLLMLWWSQALPFSSSASKQRQPSACISAYAKTKNRSKSRAPSAARKPRRKPGGSGKARWPALGEVIVLRVGGKRTRADLVAAAQVQCCALNEVGVEDEHRGTAAAAYGGGAGGGGW